MINFHRIIKCSSFVDTKFALNWYWKMQRKIYSDITIFLNYNSHCRQYIHYSEIDVIVFNEELNMNGNT